MCGRFDFHGQPHDFEAVFGGLPALERLPERYNIAPTNLAWAVAQSPDNPGELSSYRAEPMHFGWQFSQGQVRQVLNSRFETARERPIFRAALGHRRCVIFAHGFYEWQRKGKIKQPYYFSQPSEAPFAFAGLYQATQKGRARFVIFTTEARSPVSEIHGRMPLILPNELILSWLSPKASRDDAYGLLEVTPPARLRHWPVSQDMNRATFENARAIVEISSCA